MCKEVIVLFSQILFNIFKVLEIKYTYQNKIGSLLLNSVWINLVSLVSTYYAIDDLLKGNFTIIIFYIIKWKCNSKPSIRFTNKIWIAFITFTN